MDEEELQRYLEMATQLIPIEEEEPTEQPTVNNETNVQSDVEASEESASIGSASIGGSHGKEPGMIRISGFNPNGIKQQQLETQIQHCIDSSIDVQCFSEINLDVYKTKVRTELVKTIKKMDKQARSVWGTSQFVSNSEYKPGGTSIVTLGKTAGRVKDWGSGPLGRWTYQLLRGKGDTNILIVSIYQCCNNRRKNQKKTAYHQQQVMLSELDREDTDPRRNFYNDIVDEINRIKNNSGGKTIPLIIGDWNEPCTGTTNAQKICNEFGLVNIFDHLYPNHPKFNTQQDGSRCIDYALQVQN